MTYKIRGGSPSVRLTRESPLSFRGSALSLRKQPRFHSRHATAFDLMGRFRNKWTYYGNETRLPVSYHWSPNMKIIRPLCTVLLSALCSLSSASAATPPSFTAEAPDEGARILVETYLPLLASGDFERAISLNDLRGMREYFLARRLAELKAKSPGLTAQDLDEMSAQLQLNDLNPIRLKDILRNVLTESGFENMTWSIQDYAPAPEAIGGYLVRIQAQTATGQDKPIMLGIKKLGSQWMVAPEIIEKMAGQTPVATQASEPDAPPEVHALVEQFWAHWKQGELNETHSLLGAEFRERVPLLAFLQQAQEIMADIGIPLTWSVVQCRVIGPSVLGLGVDVQGSKAEMQTIMIFQKTSDIWVLEDSQFRLVSTEKEPAAPAAPTPSSSPRFRSNLRPDLKSPFLSSPAPAKRTVPAGGEAHSPALE